MSELERRYRRLLPLYPRDHRESTGEDMLGVLMAGAGDRTRPGWRETADLLWNAARLHLRRVLAADGGVDTRDVLAIVSLLGPLVVLAEAVPGLHELAWFLKTGGPGSIPWLYHAPDAPLWVLWFVVAVFAMMRWRVAAAVGAWLGTAGFVLLEIYASFQHLWTSLDAGWVLLGALTALGLTFSPGPARGLELVRPRGVVVMAASVAVIGLLAVLSFSGLSSGWPWLVLLAACAVNAAGNTRVGRRAALILAVPVIPVVLWHLAGEFAHEVNIVLYYGVPLSVVLAGGALPRRPWRRTT